MRGVSERRRSMKKHYLVMLEGKICRIPVETYSKSKDAENRANFFNKYFRSRGVDAFFRSKEVTFVK